jgi:hypothetical protein
MTKDIPMIAHMIFINDVILNSEGKQYDITANDKSYYNTNYDSYSDYCQNTAAWD